MIARMESALTAAKSSFNLKEVREARGCIFSSLNPHFSIVCIVKLDIRAQRHMRWLFDYIGYVEQPAPFMRHVQPNVLWFRNQHLFNVGFGMPLDIWGHLGEIFSHILLPAFLDLFIHDYIEISSTSFAEPAASISINNSAAVGLPGAGGSRLSSPRGCFMTLEQQMN